MNERIRLIWAECVIKHTKDPMNWQTVADEFAELIVKECAEVCGNVAAVRAGYNDADGRDTAYSCGDMIKEHFGV